MSYIAGLGEGVEVIGPYNLVKTKAFVGEAGFVEFVGHAIGYSEDIPPTRHRLEAAIRRLFDGAPEIVKPVVRFLDDYYPGAGLLTPAIMEELRNVDSILSDFGVDEAAARRMPDTVNMLVAGYLRSKYMFTPIGVGFGLGVRRGDLVNRAVVVLLVSDDWLNFVVACFDYEAYKEEGSLTIPCWPGGGPRPVWVKELIL